MRGTLLKKKMLAAFALAFVIGTPAMLKAMLKNTRAQQQIVTMEQVSTSSLGPRTNVTALGVSSSGKGKTLPSVGPLDLKFELLFTYSELISFGTDSPSLPMPLCFDGIDLSLMRNFSSLSRELQKISKASDVVRSATAMSRGFYVAAILRNSCKLASHFALEIIKLVLMLGADGSKHIFVSVLESGSTDCSTRVISLLKEILDLSRVPNNIRFGLPSEQGEGTRVDHLSKLRNEVLSDLYASEHDFDEVIYLNDVYFCASDILRLLTHNSADIKCGLDMELIGNTPKFYDTWVARDLTGQPFSKDFPFVRDPVALEAIKQRLPFQVTSCWNGLVVLKARAFAKGVRIRRSLTSDECHASECEIICHDFAALGFPKVLLDPNVLVSYDSKTFEALEKVSGKVGRVDFNLRTVSHVPTLEGYRDRPACSSCVPLDGSKGRDPDHSKTYSFNWLSFYQERGVPIASNPRAISIHDCTDSFARSCTIPRGIRSDPVLWNASSC